MVARQRHLLEALGESVVRVHRLSDHTPGYYVVVFGMRIRRMPEGYGVSIDDIVGTGCFGLSQDPHTQYIESPADNSNGSSNH